MKHVLRFLIERETKGAIRYQECGPNDIPIPPGAPYIVGTIYIRKPALTLPTPEAITITIDF